MNEKIKELSEQSGLEYNFDPMTWLKYNKFAELIVRECMEIANDYDGCKLSGPGMLIANDIEEHFGLK